MFEPRLAMASLSGTSDAAWARSGLPYVGAAFLGGIAICDRTRGAARRMRARGRDEFLPADLDAFIDGQLADLAGSPIRPGINVRTVDRSPLRAVAAICARHDAILEINAHCRQDEMCAAGAGEALLADTARLAAYVDVATNAGAVVSVKVRAEVPNVDLVETAEAIEAAGGDAIHIDAMDTEEIVDPIAEAVDLFVIANNGIRDADSARTYLAHGADALSIGRACDEPAVLREVAGTLADEGLGPATIDRKPSPG